ncbi:Elongator subunit elp4 [Friedmanniomyces endolithicus]|nr:Elongator subunit elp4 [Friedmanniomyces endolithicus]KAK0825987.1 Elongator subunit elp4 [Friedmanniomyces endolithicus]
MAFRKRNVVVGRGRPSESASTSSPAEIATGVRPSPLTSHSVTSTGTPSLDDILGGHSGLPLGSSLLIEESGTTDFAGALLRFYAAEGICQGHVVHLVGLGEAWVRGLPGIAEERGSRKKAVSSDADEKMKIAWRYERLGQVGARVITLPLELFPRSLGSIRWAELLCDGVMELTPFPHLMDASSSVSESGGARGVEEQPQGMLKVHKLPINTERGEGGAGAGNSIGADLAFMVSRRKFLIQPFSLPPVEGDQEAQKDAGKLTGKDVEF